MNPQYEPIIRLGFFFGIFAVIALWEILAPKRELKPSVSLFCSELSFGHEDAGRFSATVALSKPRSPGLRVASTTQVRCSSQRM